LTSTLSLVVAAAKVGEQIHVIDNQMSSALILLAVITCIITPAVFKRIFPFSSVSSAKQKVVLLGANQLTLPLANELDYDRFDVAVYHKNQEDLKNNRSSSVDLRYIKDYSLESMNEKDLFDADIMVVSTADEKENTRIAELAKQRDVKHIVARVETPKYAEELRAHGIQVISSLFSTKAMLRAMIESPDVALLFTTEEKGLYQLEVNNAEYHNLPLKVLPFLGDAIIVRIRRDRESIVPHGNTRLIKGDHLIVTGSETSVQRLREELS
jgi:CPA2 family monovalent cation:H+ antiporter-2